MLAPLAILFLVAALCAAELDSPTATIVCLVLAALTVLTDPTR